MDRLVDEILADMARPHYVPSEAEAQVLIAFYLKQISEKLK